MRKILVLLSLSLMSIGATANIYSGVDDDGIACYFRVDDDNNMQFTFGGRPANWSDLSLFMEIPLRDGDSTSFVSSNTELSTSYNNGIYNMSISLLSSGGSAIPITVVEVDIDPFLANPGMLTVKSNGYVSNCTF